MPFLQEYRFDELQKGFTVKEFDLTDELKNNCRVDVLTEITVE